MSASLWLFQERRGPGARRPARRASPPGPARAGPGARLHRLQHLLSGRRRAPALAHSRTAPTTGAWHFFIL